MSWMVTDQTMVADSQSTTLCQRLESNPPASATARLVDADVKAVNISGKAVRRDRTPSR
jgi:hypothetical protein